MLLPVLLLAALLPSSPATETAASSLQEEQIEQITHAAALIFSGTVIEIQHTPANVDTTAVTQITFRVENGIRGVRKGTTIQIREWAGLWNSGERYRMGQHVFLFLHAPSKLGLTSPVRGRWGRYEINNSGEVLVDGAGHRPQPLPLKTFNSYIRRGMSR